MLAPGKTEEGAVAKGYWIVQVDVADAEGYKPYMQANGMPIAAHGGKFLIRNGQHVGVEGSMRPRIVVIEFPSYEAALACYRSQAYQSIIPLRSKVAECDFTVIEGFEA